jgi:two-component system CheB/CheR fusion protein
VNNDHRLSELESKLRAINDELVATVEQSKTLREMLPEFENDQRLAELKRDFHFAEKKLLASIERSKILQETLLLFEDEMSSLLTSSEIGAMCLDKQLYIKSATPYMQKLFNITPADIGRPIDNRLGVKFALRNAGSRCKTGHKFIGSLGKCCSV